MYTCTGPELGIAAPPPPELGLGGGLCWAALDRYLRGVAIPRSVTAPEDGDALHTEIRQRQVAALAGVWPRIREWHASPDGSWRDHLPVPVPGPGRDLASRTRAEWRRVRTTLDRGQPVLLTLLPEAGAYSRPRSARQVLATAWSRTGFRVTLSLYDPDCPDDDEIRLGFSLAGELDARTTGGTLLRGFFPVGYDRSPTRTLRTETFDDRSVIGLNRTIRGRPSPAVGRRHIALIARNERGALLHFSRRRGQPWEGANITEAESFGAYELHSDPVALYRAGTLHAFARSYTGDLLHFRRGRSWSLTNRTEHKRAGPRFRLAGAPVPVAGPRLQLSVLGRDSDGGLVHYHGVPFRGWRAEQVPGDRVADDPVAVQNGDTLHVVGVAPDGRILHWVRDQLWSMTDTDAGPGPTVRLAGRPQLHTTEAGVCVLGRSLDHELVVLQAGDDGVWERAVLADHLAGDPSVTDGPGGLHAFAPTDAGGLVHAWNGDDGWTAEDVVTSRPTLAPDPPGEAHLAAWGSETRLRVFLRRGGLVRAFTWTPDSDWVADSITDRASDVPITFRDHGGEPHTVFTDRRGTIVHIEAGEWEEPGPKKGTASSVTVAMGALSRSRTAERAEWSEVAEEAEPTEWSEVVEDAEEAEEAEQAVSMDQAADRRAADEAIEPLPLLEFDDPPETEDVEPLPLLEFDDPPETEEPDTVLDFEAEQRMAHPEPEPEPEPEPAAAPEPEPVEEWEPDLDLEPEPESEAALELELADPDEPFPDRETPSSPDQESEPAAGAKREFRWDERPPPISPDEIEPMDLSLLDTWPPTSRRGKRRDRREANRENGTDQEAP